MRPGFHIHELSGGELEPWLDRLGDLRIRIFKEYPYLYDGSREYERDYLRIYQRSARSLVVIVTDASGEPVGATTCLPLGDEGPEFQHPFLAAGHDVLKIMYFGESVLLPEWRGQGLGRDFFARREAHSRRLGMPTTAFCAVDRPENHPLRPAGFRPLDGFWQSLGYVKRPLLQASFSWKEIGEETDSPKSLTFWMKSCPL